MCSPGSHPAPRRRTRLRVKMILQMTKEVTGWSSVLVDSLQIYQSWNSISGPPIMCSIKSICGWGSLNWEFWSLRLKVSSYLLQRLPEGMHGSLEGTVTVVDACEELQGGCYSTCLCIYEWTLVCVYVGEYEDTLGQLSSLTHSLIHETSLY